MTYDMGRGSLRAVRPTGRNARAIKYDLLTAMGALALASDKGRQRLILRLMTLITARYNWARDELAVGQREIARLWGVDERTVKREMAKLRAMEWLRVTRQGARGRVTEYALGIERILSDSEPRWDAVGPDFALRMSGAPPDENVVPLRTSAPVPPPLSLDGEEWSLAKAVLHAEDQGLYAAWIAGLEKVTRAGGRLTLKAPTRFHASYVLTHLLDRLTFAVQSVDETVSEISVVT